MIFKQPVNSQRRIVRKFLLWPKTLQYETRWLMWANIEQYYESFSSNSIGSWEYYKWVD